MAGYTGRIDPKDLLIRGLFLLAGATAAALLMLRGLGSALPGLAIGGTLGAFAMARFGPPEA